MAKKPKTDPYGTEPMFLVDMGSGGQGEEATTRKALKSVRQGKCPHCKAPTTGLVHTAGHLTWRPHTYRTWAGTSIPCMASGVAVCVAPERNPLVASDPARCPHEKGKR